MESSVAARPAGDLADLQLSPEEQERELEEMKERDPERYAALVAERAAADAAAQEGAGEASREEEDDPGAVSSPIVVTGTEEGGRKWAGKAPSTVVISLSGVKFEATGGFKKGEIFEFSGSARVVSEGVKDKLDKDTLLPSESVQAHEARVLDFRIG